MKNMHTICTFLLLILGNFTGCDWTGETWDCCSNSHPCGLFEGDCDGDDECNDNLLCGSNNCFSFFSSTADCCIEPGKNNAVSTVGMTISLEVYKSYILLLEL